MQTLYNQATQVVLKPFRSESLHVVSNCVVRDGKHDRFHPCIIWLARGPQQR
jgi:hypothetical protein